MKYLFFELSGNLSHIQSGIAYNKDHIHERRTMAVSELMIITDGEIDVHHLEDYHLVKNDIFLLPQGIEHYGTRKSSCTLHWHHFLLPENFRVVEENEIPSLKRTENSILLPIQFSANDIDKLLLLSFQLEQHDFTDHLQKQVRNALFTSLLLEIDLLYREKNRQFTNKKFNSILSYIDNNFQHHPFTISDLAEKFGYNKKYLFTLFKRNIHISPQQYIIQQKMKEAKRMLLETSETVESIAISLNYDSPQYFMRQFRQYFDMTPTDMRKAYSNSLTLYLSPKTEKE